MEEDSFAYWRYFETSRSCFVSMSSLSFFFVILSSWISRRRCSHVDSRRKPHLILRSVIHCPEHLFCVRRGIVAGGLGQHCGLDGRGSPDAPPQEDKLPDCFLLIFCRRVPSLVYGLGQPVEFFLTFSVDYDLFSRRCRAFLRSATRVPCRRRSRAAGQGSVGSGCVLL